MKGKKLNEFSMLEEYTLKELQARGIDISSAEVSENELAVEQLKMRNHRTNAYTPFITFTMLKANLKTPTGNHPIAVYVKRGKVPV